MKRLIAVCLCAVMAACAGGREKTPPREEESVKSKAALEAKRPKAAHAALEAKKPKAAHAAKKSKKDTETPPAPSRTDPAPVVTLTQDVSTLGETVLYFGEHIGGSLVLVSGIETHVVAPVAFQQTEFKSVAEQLAAASGCKLEAYPRYCLIYPEGDASVLQIDVAGSLNPVYAAKTVAMTFGAQTPLYKVFAMMGNALEMTIVSDIIVGDAKCGALTLVEMPVSEAVEAVLRSARLQPGSFQIESTPEYIFVYATQNASPQTTLLNGEALTPEQNAALNKPVEVVLPAPPADPAQWDVPMTAAKLEAVLGVLTQQFGLTVTVEPGLGALPLNACAFRHIRIRALMDLLIRQWPEPEFGYEFANNQIVIQRRK